MKNATDRQNPTSAVIAVTMLCNSRCIMCDIWKNRGMDFLPVDVYRKLPSSLRMVDITGGEPFLRPDIPDIVRTVRSACPRARILITTNGFLPEKIARFLPDIMQADPDIAFRVSLDGWGKHHERVRRIPDAFEKVMKTVKILKDARVKDIGLIFTIMKQNAHQLGTVYRYCQDNGLNFSLNVVHDSPVYFGSRKISLRPEPETVKEGFRYVFIRQILRFTPKEWAKAWFNAHSYRYMKTHRRPIACGAGERFFYMDPFANVFMCHLKNWPIGNLKKSTFEQIWTSQAKRRFLPAAAACHDCWIVCTAKDAIRANPLHVISQLPALGLEMHTVEGNRDNK